MHIQLKGYHAGQLEVQSRAVVQDKAQSIQALFATRPISEQLQSFFSIQRLLYTATRGDNGRLWASVLSGQPSYIQTPNAYQAVINPLKQFKGDPAQYHTGNPIGMVGVMFQNRRRNLLNGIIADSEGGKLLIDVYQALGNCPKYIQVRDLKARLSGCEAACSTFSSVTRGKTELQTPQQEFIARSDTFFIASVHMATTAESGVPSGCSLHHINHRGGYPGFVQVDSSGKLVWGDYAGNNAFNTLGNLILDPEAALLFIDFTTGDTLHLSGQAQVHWDEAVLPGAQRTVKFQTEEWVHVKGALPIQQQGPAEASPYNPAPPVTLQNPQATNLQHLQCLSTKQESQDVMTFEFELPQLSATKTTFCLPGQFASFDFQEVAPGKILNRTWTISSSSQQMEQRKAFTISVKKDGLVSNWLFDNMRPGKTIGFKGVDGTFTLELIGSTTHARVLLVAGGIGITPMRVLLAERLARQLPVSLLYFVRSLAEAPFLQELVEAAQNSHGLFALAVSITRPTEQSTAQALSAKSDSAVSWHQGRITKAMLTQICPDVKSCLVFQCGPTPMMQLVSTTLESMQMPMAHVFQEAFGF